MSSEFDITVDRTGQLARLHATGLLDAYAGELLRTTIAAEIAQGATRIELEASAIDFIDSGGLRVLVGAHSDLAARHGCLVIVEPSETVAQILQLTDLAARFGL